MTTHTHKPKPIGGKKISNPIPVFDPTINYKVENYWINVKVIYTGSQYKYMNQCITLIIIPPHKHLAASFGKQLEECPNWANT